MSKYSLKGTFFTDGDYEIDLDSFDEEYRKFIKRRENYDEYYEVDFKTNVKSNMGDFLSMLIVSFRVRYTHTELLFDLIVLVDQLICSLCSKKCRTVNLDGNYDHTKLTLEIN